MRLGEEVGLRREAIEQALTDLRHGAPTEPDPADVRVVTSDRWLADRAWAAGASVEGADSFRNRLDNS